MKILVVVDSISDIKKKIELLKNNFGDNLIFVVKKNLLNIFKTYNYSATLTYNKGSTSIINEFISKSPADDYIIYYSSLKLNNNFLKIFINKIANGKKVVNIMPKYNLFENIWHSIYNLYIQLLFKNKDSLASPKLQYLPKEFVLELSKTHIGNKLFKINSKLVKNIEIEDKSISKTSKQKISFNKLFILPIILLIVTTLILIINIQFFKLSFLIALIYLSVYILTIFISIIFLCKSYFDNRFFK